MPLHDTLWPFPRLIAHRGAGTLAPENTLAAMRVGAQYGYAMVEYDVKLTRDGVAVLLHDDSVDRTSNGQGKLSELNFNDLVAMDFGGWHSRAYAGEPIATLHAISAFTQANGIYSNIEIKPSAGTDAATGRQVARLAAQLWTDPASPPLLSSFSEAALLAAQDEAPHLPRALLLGDTVPDDWPDRLARLGCSAIDIQHTLLTQELINEAHERGYRITTWTVNDPQLAGELLALGCDALFTDAIREIAP